MTKEELDSLPDDTTILFVGAATGTEYTIKVGHVAEVFLDEHWGNSTTWRVRGDWYEEGSGQVWDYAPPIDMIHIRPTLSIKKPTKDETCHCPMLVGGGIDHLPNCAYAKSRREK